MRIDEYAFVELNKDYDYDSYIANIIREAGINYFLCNTPLKNIPFFLRPFFKLHTSGKLNSIIEMPFKTIWRRYFLNKKLLKDIARFKTIYFLLGDTLRLVLDSKLIGFLRKRFPGCKIIYVFPDKVASYLSEIEKKTSFSDFVSSFDLVCTFNKLDAARYDIVLQKPCIYFSFHDSPAISYDAVFIGKEKGRLNKLINLYDLLEINGFNCCFYIIGVSKKDQIKRPGIVYRKYLPYEEVLKIDSSSKCIVNIVQDGASGITLRDYEAIGMNKVLITNNINIKSYPFYTDKKVIILQDDVATTDFTNINQFDPKEAWNNVDDYSITNYFKWLLENVK